MASGSLMNALTQVIGREEANELVSGIFSGTALVVHNGVPAAYTDLVTAQSMAVSGDVIVVAAGTYLLSAALGKDGVNWFFYPGAILNSIAGNRVWQVLTAMTFKVGGYGRFVSGVSLTHDIEGIYINHPSANVQFNFESVFAQGTSCAGIRVGTCTKAVFNWTGAVQSDLYDALWCDKGYVIVRGPELLGGQDGIETGPFAANQLTLIVDIPHIQGTGGSQNGCALNLQGGTSYIRTNLLDLTGDDGSTACVQFVDGIHTVDCPTVNGIVTCETAGTGPKRLIGAKITPFASLNGVLVSNNLLELENCRINMTDSTASISDEGSAQTVTVFGSIKYNTEPTANITLAGPMIKPPKSDPHIAGALWNNAGTATISSG